MFCIFLFFKQKTAYEMRISDWSSDVCSSDLIAAPGRAPWGSSVHDPVIRYRTTKDPVGSRLDNCGDLAIDKAYGDSYIRIMCFARRLLLVAVLVTYVAGLGVLAATSSAMAGNMVMGEAGEMGDCQGCDPVGGDDPVSACEDRKSTRLNSSH